MSHRPWRQRSERRTAPGADLRRNADPEFLDPALDGGRALIPFSAQHECMLAGASISQGQPVSLEACAATAAAAQTWHGYFFGWQGWGDTSSAISPASRR